MSAMYLTYAEPARADPEELTAWQVKLEYLTWLLGSRPIPSEPPPSLIGASILGPLERELSDLFASVSLAVAGSKGDDDPAILSLQRTLRLESLHVRGEGTPASVKWLARGLYSAHAQWFRAN
jgi:hypothetical protein